MAEKPTYAELEQRIQEIEQRESEQKKAEEALQESEARFQLLYERAPLGYQSLDEDGNFIEVNPAWLDILGYLREEVIGKSFSEFLHSDWKDHFKENFPRFKAVGEVLGVEFEMVKKDGSFILVSFNGKIGKDKDGGFKQTHCILQDISERKLADEALRASEKQYRLLADNITDSIWVLALDTLKFSYVSPSIVKIAGFTADELMGLHIEDVLMPSSLELAINVLTREWADEGLKHKPLRSRTLELEQNRKNGTTVWIEAAMRLIYDAEGQPISILGVARDISERKQAEEERKKLEAQLQQAYKIEAIGTLTGGVAHDFNNILSIIIGNTELALDDVPEWNPAHLSLENIKAASLRATGIVQQLLRFSRKTDHALKPTGIITVIKDAINFIRSTIPTTIEIRKNMPTSDTTVLADPVQINQIMMNLCINASQEMEETGGILEITVENITLDEEAADSYIDIAKGDYVQLTVSDTGPGIDPESIRRIFDPYFTTKEIGKGSGMGLAVVHGIVINHRGAITVDSEPGKGTTFKILFPVATEKPEIETVTMDKPPIGTETILFVDDEESIVNIIERILERLGYTVETRISPIEALELFKSKPDQFDLVITDMAMPQMTGVNLSEKLRNVRSDIPVIICTGHSDLIDDVKAKRIGLNAYVMKPIVKQDIAEVIRKVLDDWKS